MLLPTWVNICTCYSCVCILYVNQLFVRADDEDQAAELSRLLDQKAYLEELNKKLEYVIYSTYIVIIPYVWWIPYILNVFIYVFTEYVDLHTYRDLLETCFCMYLYIHTYGIVCILACVVS